MNVYISEQMDRRMDGQPDGQMNECNKINMGMNR